MSAVSNVLTQTTPGPDRAGEPVGPLHVARPDPGRQAVRRVVGDPERLGLVVELGHGQDRPEDLLARDPPVVRRRRRGSSAGCRSRRSPRGPARRRRRPGRPPRARARRSPAPCRAGARRRSRRAASPDRAARPARASRPSAAIRSTSSSRTERWTIEPRARVAGLAAVVEDPPADRRRGRLEVADVGEDDLRALPAELERDRLDVRSRRRPGGATCPTSVEPVKAILSTAGMARQRRRR